MSQGRIRSLALVLVAFALMAGCQAAKEVASSGAPARPPAAPASKADEKSLTVARATHADSVRKVIYKAELSIEVRSPVDAQAKVTSLVEREGGYVASAAREASEGGAADVTLVVKVPAEKFTSVLAELRRLGDGKRAERIDSEDVTDEFVDLDARLRVQTRLEEQLLELLKTATTIDGALGVHKELANVRTEIERIQGRKQLLEREVTMSTIRLTLGAPPVESVSFSKIGSNFHEAYSDALLVGGGIIVVAIRTTGVLVPVAVILGLPALLVVLTLRRRARRALGAPTTAGVKPA